MERVNFCHFFLFHDRTGRVDVSPDDVRRLASLVAGVAGLGHALIHQPADATDPFLDDGAQLRLAVQMYFAELPALEAALGTASGLHALADPATLSSLRGAQATQQSMLIRPFPVPQPRPQEPGDTRGTYLVAYDGRADDLNAWLSHYLDHHPPIMARFPAIREIEIYTRLDWRGAVPIARADCLQRNKVVFDSPAALDAALHSPVRQAMRDDYHALPAFAGTNTHDALLTHRIEGGSPV